MAKIIHKRTKKNAAIVKQELENTTVHISDGQSPPAAMPASEALTLATQRLAEMDDSGALLIADQLLPQFGHIIDIHLIKLRALVNMERLVDASAFADNALKAAPTNQGVLLHTARLKIVLGDDQEALRLLKKANELNPNRPIILTQMARCFSHTGHKDDALQCHKKVLKIYAKRGERGDLGDLSKEAAALKGIDAFLGVGQLDSWSDENIQIAEQLIMRDQIPKRTRSRIALGLSVDASRQKDLEREIGLLHIGNQLMREDLAEKKAAWSHDISRERLERNKEIFNKAQPDWLDGYTSDRQEAPICILAMPRSGTTLQEQMLGSHSQIGQTGESKGIPTAIQRAYADSGVIVKEYPASADKIKREALDKAAEYYISHQRLLTDKQYFVDKQLSIYVYVGLIAQLFPNAKFIHMSRNPLDIFLSCYRGGIPGSPATCSIEHMAYEFMHMKKLIAHWKAVFPDRVHIVNYQELVEDPETIMRETIDFLGLEWEDDVLQFHKRKNVVRTLSLHQVRKGIYNTSVRKWLPYKSMMQPAIEVLLEHGFLEEADIVDD